MIVINLWFQNIPKVKYVSNLNFYLLRKIMPNIY